MIANYSFLNKAYFVLLILGIIITLLFGIFFLFLQKPEIAFFLGLGVSLMIAGIICKVLVWYNVYSEVVTKEEFKKATMSGCVFQKKRKF